MIVGDVAEVAAVVAITTHAAERYRERVKPHLSLDRARWELEQLAAVAGPPSPNPPAWIKRLEPAPLWLEISDGLALALSHRGVALTVLIRAGLSEGAREARNAYKKRRRRRR